MHGGKGHWDLNGGKNRLPTCLKFKDQRKTPTFLWARLHSCRYVGGHRNTSLEELPPLHFLGSKRRGRSLYLLSVGTNNQSRPPPTAAAIEPGSKQPDKLRIFRKTESRKYGRAVPRYSRRQETETEATQTEGPWGRNRPEEEEEEEEEELGHKNAAQRTQK